MRRPVLYLAGLLLATGASLALAGPASAAPKGCGECGPSYYPGQAYYPGQSYFPGQSYYPGGQEVNSFNGIQLLGNQGSGNLGIIPILSPFS
jgi:hypothetical protein